MSSDTTLPARLRITHGDGEGALLRFAFGARDDDPFAIPCTRLAGPAAEECWHAGELSETADTCGAAWAHGEHYAMVALRVAENGRASCRERVYSNV